MSSETAGAAVATYAFEQLSTPAATEMEDIADVVSAAIEEAEQIRQQARAEGEAEGRAAGRAAAQAEVDQALATLRDAAKSVAQLRADLTAQLERDAVELALLMSEQIVSGTLSVQPERVIDIARNALRHLTDRRQVTLIVNPADLEILGDGVEALRAELGGIEHLAVQSDRRIGRGGVLAQTDVGEIDSSLTAQLSRAREVVAEALAAPSSDVA